MVAVIFGVLLLGIALVMNSLRRRGVRRPPKRKRTLIFIRPLIA
jgi:hypothetical protein